MVNTSSKSAGVIQQTAEYLTQNMSYEGIMLNTQGTDRIKRLARCSDCKLQPSSSLLCLHALAVNCREPGIGLWQKRSARK
jgi:hypothetical protein